MSKKVAERNYKLALEAIETVFSDTSVSQEHTLANLRSLKYEIETKIACIQSDLK